MRDHTMRSRQSGATLIEVLVSVVVSSIGLLGIAALVATTSSVNQGAYARTQLALAAQALIDSMHINTAAIAQGSYAADAKGSAAADVDCVAHACNANQRARYDIARFDRSIAAAVPNARTSLQCHASTEPAASGTYDGVCRLQVAWSDHLPAIGNAAGAQSLVWVFQP